MGPAPVPDSVAKQAELLKQDGNTFFKKDRIGAAIDAYTEVHFQFWPLDFAEIDIFLQFECYCLDLLGSF